MPTPSGSPSLSRWALLAALTALGGAGLVAMGGFADPTTTPGDLMVRGPGDAGIVRLGLGADASVLTSINGAPVWAAVPTSELPAASGPGEILVSDDAGSAYTPTAATGVWALLAATRVTTPDLTSATGWTVTNLLLGSGAVSGGAYTSTIPTGTIAATGSYITRGYTYAPQWELQGRVQITNDTAGELLAGLSGVWSGGVLSLYVRGSGAFYLYQEGAWGFAGLTISGSGFAVDGTGWVRLRVNGTRVQAWSGIGSGSTPPTVWTLRADTTMAVAIGAAQPVSVRLSGFSNDTHLVPAGTTVVWRSVTLTALTLGVP